MVFLQDGLGFFDWFVGAIVFLVAPALDIRWGSIDQSFYYFLPDTTQSID